MKGSMTAFSFTGLFVLGGGACAALAAAIMAAAVTADESTSVGSEAFCLLFPGGPGACAVLPTDTGFHSELYMLQTDVLHGKPDRRRGYGSGEQWLTWFTPAWQLDD